MIKLLPKNHQLWRGSEPSEGDSGQSRRSRRAHPWRRVFALVGALLLIIVIPSVLVVYFHPSKAQAAWFDNNWGFRQRIDTTITSSSSDISNLETLITVNTSTLITNSKLQSSCQDLRFTNVNGKVLNYYIDSGCNTTTTKIWVMADLVPKNTTVYTLYMYYGNTLAAAGSNSHYFDNVVGLQGYWTFNDASSGSSTTVTDSSVNANTGTWNGTLGSQWTASGQYSNAGVFNGSNNYVNAPNLTLSGNQSTVESWINVTNVVNYRDIMKNTGNSGSGQLYFFISITDRLVHAAFAGVGGVSVNPVPLATWTHVAATYDGSTIKIYINGVLDKTTSVSNNSFSFTGENIGAQSSGVAENFLGNLDDTKVYSTARTAQQIAADYANTSCGGLTCTIATSPVGTSGPTTSFAAEETNTGPVAYWKFDEGTGTTANNVGTSGTAANGTLTNMSSPPTSTSGWQTEDQCISGKCLRFNGTNNYVDAGNSSLLNFERTNPFSVGLWVKTAQTGNNNTLITKAAGSGSTPGWWVEMTNGKFDVYLTNNISGSNYIEVRSTGPVFNDNNWHYLTMAYSGSSTAAGITLYVDGTAQPVFVASDTLSATIQSAGHVNIGSYNNGTGLFFSGTIDEVKIYPYTRTAAQVKSDFLIGQAKIGGSSSTSNNQQQFLSQGLLGYWKFDETSGNAIDSSGNGNTLTWNGTGGTAHYTTGKYGGGGGFNGTDDYVTNNMSGTSLTSTTVSVWFKANSLSGTNGIFQWAVALNYDSPFILVQNNNGTLKFYADGNYRELSQTLTTGTWYHAVVTLSNSKTWNFYLNGKLLSTYTGGTTFQNQGTKVFFGNGYNGFFNGTTDEARIYNRALSAQEVYQLYNYAPGPVGWWKFDERTGSSVFDSSSQGNTGTWAGTLGKQWTAGKYGSAGNFTGLRDGTDNYVNMGNVSVLNFERTNAFTLGAWINSPAPTSGNSYTIVSKINGSPPYTGYTFTLRPITGYLDFQLNNSGSNSIEAQSQTNVEDGKWHYVVVTYDGSSNTSGILFYIDGVLKTTTSTFNALSSSTQSTNPFNIGDANNNAVPYSFKGQIDDVRVYNYARTQAQIQQDMQGSTNANTNSGGSTATSQPAAPVGYWKFDEGYGTTANNDGSGGSTLNGTLTNMASPATSTSGWQIGVSNCKLGNCLAFNGTNNYVAMPSDVAALKITSAVTLDAWVKLTSTAAQNDIIAKWTGTASTSSYELFTDTSGKLNMKISDGTTITTTTGNTVLATGTWYHVMGVYNPSTSVTLYVNGNQDKQTTASIPAALQNSTTILDIGAENAGTNPMNGKIDEAKIFPYALTQDQVRTDYNLGAAVNYSGGTNEAANQPSGAGAAPVGDWEFEERTGTTVNDSSGQGNTGTWNGTGTKHWTLGKIGAAGNFNGVDDFVNVPSSNSINPTSAITLSLWINPSVTLNSSTTRKDIMYKTTDYFMIHNFSVADGAMSFIFVGGGVNRIVKSATTSWAANTWYHIEGTYDGTTSKIYVNGKLENSTSYSGSLDGNTTALGIGANPTPANYFPGKIDSVRIYNYARSADQIAYDYNRGAPIARWKFDECQGTVANDSSGNGNTGTITIGASGTQTAVGTCNTAGTAWGNGATGKYNASLNFDGTDDYVNIPYSASIAPTNISVSYWVYENAQPANLSTVVARKYDTVGLPYFSDFRGTNNSQITFGTDVVARGPVDFVTSKTVTTPNKWYHVVGTFDGTSYKIYINGTLDNTLVDSTALYVGSSLELDLGALNANGVIARYFNGKIDDVRIYNYALTATQVQLLYNNGGDVFYGPTTGNPSN